MLIITHKFAQSWGPEGPQTFSNIMILVRFSFVQSDLVRNSHRSTLLTLFSATRAQDKICVRPRRLSSCLHSSARQAWSLRSAGPSQRSAAAGGWWRSCLKKKNMRNCQKKNQHFHRLEITPEHHFAVKPLLRCSPWMLSICPILSAAPRTLHRVLTILSALASDSRGESNRAFASTKQTAQEY